MTSSIVSVALVSLRGALIKTKQKKRPNRRTLHQTRDGTERDGVTPLGAIVTDPTVPRSVMTSQSTASFKDPKRKFKAKPGGAPLKPLVSGSAAGCLCKERQNLSREDVCLSRPTAGRVFVWSCIHVHAWVNVRQCFVSFDPLSLSLSPVL